jgi:hypothetical protein
MKPLLVWLSVVGLLALGATAVCAGVTADYTLQWWTVDAGGITFASGGNYSLGGTAGQADAGVLTGGAYTLAGGFWRGGAPVETPGFRVYLPLVVRNW